jgi:hypothetical protein
MKKLMIALALALAVVGGAVVVPTLTNTHAAACTNNSCGCSFTADRGFFRMDLRTSVSVLPPS